MKVLVANDLYARSSAAGVAVSTAEELAARGYDVSLLTTTQRKGEALREMRGGVDLHIEHTMPYSLRWRSRRSLDNPSGVAAMRKVVEDVKPDVVHVHNLHMHLSYASLAAARSLGAKVVLHVHDIMPVCHQKMFCHLDERLRPGDEVVYEAGIVKCAVCVKARFNPLRNRTIRRAVERDVDSLVAVSHEMGRALEHNGLPVERVIFNGVDPAAGDVPDELVESLRVRWGLGDRPVVFYGGRLDRLKGGLELVRALEVVRRKVPTAVLLTVGEALPGFYDEMLSLAARLGMDDALVHAGWLSGDELAAAYRVADVVATPSLCFESFGLVNVEAMRARRPVVASMWGGPSDVVDDGRTGFLVNPLRIGDLAERITRLLMDPDLARRLGDAARERVEKLFSIPGQVDAIERLYADLGSTGRGRSG